MTNTVNERNLNLANDPIGPKYGEYYNDMVATLRSLLFSQPFDLALLGLRLSSRQACL